MMLLTSLLLRLSLNREVTFCCRKINLVLTIMRHVLTDVFHRILTLSLTTDYAKTILCGKSFAKWLGRNSV